MNWKPPASFSMVADSGIRALSAGSFRTTAPAEGGGGGASCFTSAGLSLQPTKVNKAADIISFA